MIDSAALAGQGAATGGYDAADVSYLPPDFSKRLFWETSERFKPSRERILFAQAVRREDIVVPIPDPLISDEDANFVAYIAPERRSLESGARQTLTANLPMMVRAKLGETDQADRDLEAVTAVAEALKAELVDWDAIVGKTVEDGEFAMVMQYDLDYLLAKPLPSDVLSVEEWEKLPESEQSDWTRCEQSKGRVTYRRYKRRYWRDKDGRKPTDRYYRDVDSATGERRAFERNDLATRRAWREHMKSEGEGYVPLVPRLIPALDCAPLLVRSTRGHARWETRGLAIRMRCSQSDLVGQGLRWEGMPGLLLERGYDADESGRMVEVYEAHVYLEDPEAEGDEPRFQPCVVYQIDGRPTWRQNGRGEQEAACINLWDEYGIDFLPVEYFWGVHTDDDEPGEYARPLIFDVLSAILNQEGNRTAYQAHLRKYAFSKLATTPSKDVPAQTYLNADGTMREIDLDADIVMLPGPTGPLVQPPAPEAVRDLDAMYARTLGLNAPDAPQGGNGQSGHALVVEQSQFFGKNTHVRDGARRCVEWIVTTAVKMLAALEEKHDVKVSMFPADDVPTIEGMRQAKSVLNFDAKVFRENWRIRAVYADVGNLAEIQQEADLKERGLSTFRRVMEKKGVRNVFSERVEMMSDKFFESEDGVKLLWLEVLKRRGDMERAAILEAQLKQQITPGGLPMGALPPQLAAMAQGGGGMGMMPGMGGAPGMPPGMGGPPMGAQPMPGMQLPNAAGSALGGIVAGALGSASLQRDAMAQAQMPAGPGGGL